MYLVGFLVIFAAMSVFGQNKGLKFDELDNYEISLEDIEARYTGAIHHDLSLAVFKTAEEQKAMIEAYTKLFHDLSEFLTVNNFEWEKTTRSFNRVYFKEDGIIDHFIYKFLGEEIPIDEKDKEFQRLLNLFIADYQLPITADERFVQCSPITYEIPSSTD